MARNKELRIEGFPDFGGALTELKQFQRAPKPEFQVCVGLEGALVIKQALVEFWSRKEHFADRMNSLVNQHNEEFNPKNLKRGAEENPEDPESSAAQPPAKRLCLGTAKTVSELETEYTDRREFGGQPYMLPNRARPNHWTALRERTQWGNTKKYLRATWPILTPLKSLPKYGLPRQVWIQARRQQQRLLGSENKDGLLRVPNLKYLSLFDPWKVERTL